MLLIYGVLHLRVSLLTTLLATLAALHFNGGDLWASMIVGALVFAGFWIFSALGSESCVKYHEDDCRFDQEQPRFNVDGTPMVGSFDTNGNPYGVTSPAVNVNGAPMVGGVRLDIFGNSFGSTFNGPFHHG